MEQLVSTVERVNDELAGERREKALRSVDAKIAEASQALDGADANADLRNRALKPLQDLKAQLAPLVSIPHIMFLQQRAEELLDEAMDHIARAGRGREQTLPVDRRSNDGGPKGDDGSPPNNTDWPNVAKPPAARPIKVIRTSDLAAKTYLDSAQDVEDYLTKLRRELLAAIESGHRARLQ